jgi:hypothetical protein
MHKNQENEIINFVIYYSLCIDSIKIILSLIYEKHYVSYSYFVIFSTQDFFYLFFYNL